MDDYVVKRINGKMCYVQRLPLILPSKTGITPAKPSSTLYSPKLGHPTPIHQSQVHPQSQLSNQNAPQSDKSHPPTLDKRLIRRLEEKLQPYSSLSSSEDSGINAVGRAYTESYDEEEEREQESRSDVESSHGSYFDQEDLSLLAPLNSLKEIVEKIETTL